MEPKELEEKREEYAAETEAPQADVDYDKPVAYGPNGEPLYAHPIDAIQKGPQFVHMTRSVNPVKQELTPEMKDRHDQSVAAYPNLNLSEEEYIIRAMSRHPIGLVGLIAMTVVLSLLAIIGYAGYGVFVHDATLQSTTNLTLPSAEAVFIPFLLLLALILIGGYVACYVYLQNRFYLTNESVIQEIQLSLFNHDEQTISLANIEDVSYRQTGIMQQLFDYGTIRMSTEGDETTYTFAYAGKPKEQAAILNNAVEAFKNGRPVLQDTTE